MGLFSKIKKGFKRGINKVGKGIKRGAEKVGKGFKSAGFNKDFGKDFAKGFAMAGKALMKPEEWIRKNDPLGKKMKSFGAFSPISLGGAILLAPITAVGYLEQAMVDKKIQKKIREGNPEEIMNLSFAALALAPLGAGSKALKEGQKKLLKPVVNAVSKSGLKNMSKLNVFKYADKTITNLNKTNPKLITKILPQLIN
jgi:hypothetical protein